jgi:hypothetical protein
LSGLYAYYEVLFLLFATTVSINLRQFHGQLIITPRLEECFCIRLKAKEFVEEQGVE